MGAILPFLARNWRPILAALAAAAVAAWIGWLVHSRDAALMQAQQARADLAAEKTAYAQLAAATQRQNAAIADLERQTKERQVAAEKAVQDARQTAQAHLDRSAHYQGLKPPPGVDECQAVRQLVGDYLRERRSE